MSNKNKLQKFAENLTFGNLFQYSYEDLQTAPFPLKGKWNTDFFHNGNPIVLELGCGKGEYTVGLAEMHPDINYIGIDIKGARLWRGLKTAQEKNLGNVAFIRTRIDLINWFFAENEVSEIWVTFADPQPSKPKKRLTSALFLNYYRKFVKRDGYVNLKTDSDLLYESTKEIIAEQHLPVVYDTADLYATDEALEVKLIQTFYEKMWLAEGKTIKFVRFGLN